MSRKPKRKPKGITRELPRGIDYAAGKFRVRVFWQGRQHMIGAYHTLQDAEAAQAIARSEMARQIFIPPRQRRQEIKDAELLERIEGLTVAEWAVDWLERLESVGRSPGTTRTYRSTLNVHILPALGEHRLIDVTPDDIDALIDEIRSRRGPWANVARTLRAMFRAAISARVGGITTSPVQVTITKPAPSATLSSDNVASPAEVRQIANSMPDHLAIAVPLAAWCALRQGEVLGLQRRDLEHIDDPARAVLHVRRQWHSKSTPPAYAPPKSGSGRSVALPAALLPALREHIAAHAGPGNTGPLLPSPRNPEVPISQSAFDRAWRPARDKVRPGFRFHDLRHTGLTAYGQQGATLEELMRRGGHRNIEAASRYQHATAERDRALTAKLDAAIGEDDA